MAKPFASSADLEEKRSRWEELASGVVAYTAEGDPNVGAVIGEDAVLAVDARATPTHAREWLDELRRLTDKSVRYLLLTHYHAVRVLGASDLRTLCSRSTHERRRLMRASGSTSCGG